MTSGLQAPGSTPDTADRIGELEGNRKCPKVAHGTRKCTEEMGLTECRSHFHIIGVPKA